VVAVDPEADLITALRRQEPDAVEQIERNFGRVLHGYLNAVLGDRATAEDVMQQTMIDVWRRGPTYDPARGSLSTWLLTIARSRAIDQLRRRIPEPYDPEDITRAIDFQSVDAADELLEQWRVAALMARLPHEESSLLKMRFHQGLSQREIAQETGIPLGTVKMRMVSGLERLRSLMDNEMDVTPR
jgi:RNA polymerase sigma-70 factor (ECF subfamily)